MESKGNTSHIISLTTDYGQSGYYVPALKGILLHSPHQLQLVDITHDIENYSIVQASFIFKNAWHTFPKGTIHFINVNNYSSDKEYFIFFKKNGHYFLGPDNGFFSLVFEEELPGAIYKFPYKEKSFNDVLKAYTYVINKFIEGKTSSQIGRKIDNIQHYINIKAVISKDYIRGTIIFIDKFGNCITNINHDTFNEIHNNRNFKLYYKRHNPIETISQFYYQVEIGEPLCLFNTTGLLQLSINQGNAHQLLGLEIDDTVQIDFFE